MIELNNELTKILKPLKHIQISFEKDVVILQLIYETGKRGTKRGSVATLRFKREKTTTLEEIFDDIRPIIIKEYLETNLNK